jgi:hypothetical protein
MFSEGSIARRSVSRVLSRHKAGMAIHLGRSLPNASRDRPERRRGRPARQRRPKPMLPAAPTWSCSRWGLPCHRRYRRRGALLPHHFTLAARRLAINEPDGLGGMFSVALSLRSPPPGVTRHRASVEPGLSSLRPTQRAWTKSGHPTVWHGIMWDAAPASSNRRRIRLPSAAPAR